MSPDEHSPTARQPSIARKVAFNVIAVVRTVVNETGEVVRATWRQTARLAGYGRGLAERRMLERINHEAERVLGDDSYVAGVGDAALRDRIAAIDSQIRQAKADKKPIANLQIERRAVVLQLSQDVFKQGPGATSVEGAIRRVGATQEVARQHVVEMGRRRTELLPRDRAEWLRVCGGWGVASCLLLVGILSVGRSGKDQPQSASTGSEVASTPPTVTPMDGDKPAAVSKVAPAEPQDVVHGYLSAKTWRERLQYVLKPAEIEPLMAERYRNNNNNFALKYEKLTDLGVQRRADDRTVRAYLGKISGSAVEDFVDYTLLPTPDGWKIDWKCSIAYNPMSLTQIKAERPKQPVEFRVGVKLDDFYWPPFGDAQDTHYSFHVVTTDGGDRISDRVHAYASRVSPVGKRLFELLKSGRRDAVMLRLRHPPESRDGTACEIVSFVRHGWFDDPPDATETNPFPPKVPTGPEPAPPIKKGTSEAVPSRLTLADAKAVLGDRKTLETGKRYDQPYVLESGRLMVIEGANALDIFFSPDEEGIRAGKEILSSKLFTSAEHDQLVALVEGRQDTEKVIGRFKVQVTVTADGYVELPKFWIRVNLEPAEVGGKEVVHAPKDLGYYTNDELYTASKHRAANKYATELLGTTLRGKELHLRIRTLDGLADGAGLSAAATLASLEQAVDTAKKKGLEPSFAESAVSHSLAFRIALNKELTDNWKRKPEK